MPDEPSQPIKFSREKGGTFQMTPDTEVELAKGLIYKVVSIDVSNPSNPKMTLAFTGKSDFNIDGVPPPKEITVQGKGTHIVGRDTDAQTVIGKRSTTHISRRHVGFHYDSVNKAFVMTPFNKNEGTITNAKIPSFEQANDIVGAAQTIVGVRLPTDNPENIPLRRGMKIQFHEHIPAYEVKEIGYGVKPYILLEIPGDSRGYPKQIKLDGANASATIGRAGTDVKINHPDISRMHGQIDFVGGEWSYTSLGKAPIVQPGNNFMEELDQIRRNVAPANADAAYSQIKEIDALVRDIEAARNKMQNVQRLEQATIVTPVWQRGGARTEDSQEGYRNWLRAYKVLYKEKLNPTEAAAFDKAIDALGKMADQRAAMRDIESYMDPPSIKSDKPQDVLKAVRAANYNADMQEIVKGQLEPLKQAGGKAYIASGFKGHHTVTMIENTGNGYVVTTYNAGAESKAAPEGGDKVMAMYRQRLKPGTNIEDFVRLVNERKVASNPLTSLSVKNALESMLEPVKPGDYVLEPPQGKGNCTTRSTRGALQDMLPKAHFDQMHALVSNPEVCDPALVLAGLQMRRDANNHYLNNNGKPMVVAPQGQVDWQQSVVDLKIVAQDDKPKFGPLRASQQSVPPQKTFLEVLDGVEQTGKRKALSPLRTKPGGTLDPKLIAAVERKLNENGINTRGLEVVKADANADSLVLRSKDQPGIVIKIIPGGDDSRGLFSLPDTVHDDIIVPGMDWKFRSNLQGNLVPDTPANNFIVRVSKKVLTDDDLLKGDQNKELRQEIAKRMTEMARKKGYRTIDLHQGKSNNLGYWPKDVPLTDTSVDPAKLPKFTTADEFFAKYHVFVIDEGAIAPPTEYTPNRENFKPTMGEDPRFKPIAEDLKTKTGPLRASQQSAGDNKRAGTMGHGAAMLAAIDPTKGERAKAMAAIVARQNTGDVPSLFKGYIRQTNADALFELTGHNGPKWDKITPTEHSPNQSKLLSATIFNPTDFLIRNDPSLAGDQTALNKKITKLSEAVFVDSMTMGFGATIEADASEGRVRHYVAVPDFTTAGTKDNPEFIKNTKDSSKFLAYLMTKEYEGKPLVAIKDVVNTQGYGFLMQVSSKENVAALKDKLGIDFDAAMKKQAIADPETGARILSYRMALGQLTPAEVDAKYGRELLVKACSEENMNWLRGLTGKPAVTVFPDEAKAGVTIEQKLNMALDDELHGAGKYLKDKDIKPKVGPLRASQQATPGPRLTPEQVKTVRGVYAQDEMRLFNAGLVFSQKVNTAEGSVRVNSYDKNYTRGTSAPEKSGTLLLSFQVPGEFGEGGKQSAVREKLGDLATDLLRAKGIEPGRVKLGQFFVEINVANQADYVRATEILKNAFEGGNNFTAEEIALAKAAGRPQDIHDLPKKLTPITSVFAIGETPPATRSDTTPKPNSPLEAYTKAYSQMGDTQRQQLLPPETYAVWKRLLAERANNPEALAALKKSPVYAKYQATEAAIDKLPPSTGTLRNLIASPGGVPKATAPDIKSTFNVKADIGTDALFYDPAGKKLTSGRLAGQGAIPVADLTPERIAGRLTPNALKEARLHVEKSAKLLGINDPYSSTISQDKAKTVVGKALAYLPSEGPQADMLKIALADPNLKIVVVSGDYVNGYRPDMLKLANEGKTPTVNFNGFSGTINDEQVIYIPENASPEQIATILNEELRHHAIGNRIYSNALQEPWQQNASAPDQRKTLMLEALRSDLERNGRAKGLAQMRTDFGLESYQGGEFRAEIFVKMDLLEAQVKQNPNDTALAKRYQEIIERYPALDRFRKEILHGDVKSVMAGKPLDTIDATAYRAGRPAEEFRIPTEFTPELLVERYGKTTGLTLDQAKTLVDGNNKVNPAVLKSLQEKTTAAKVIELSESIKATEKPTTLAKLDPTVAVRVQDAELAKKLGISSDPYISTNKASERLLNAFGMNDHKAYIQTLEKGSVTISLDPKAQNYTKNLALAKELTEARMALIQENDRRILAAAATGEKPALLAVPDITMDGDKLVLKLNDAAPIEKPMGSPAQQDAAQTQRNQAVRADQLNTLMAQAGEEYQKKTASPIAAEAVSTLVVAQTQYEVKVGFFDEVQKAFMNDSPDLLKVDPKEILPPPSQQGAPDPVAQQREFLKAAQEAQKLRAAGDFDGANKQIEKMNEIRRTAQQDHTVNITEMNKIRHQEHYRNNMGSAKLNAAFAVQSVITIMQIENDPNFEKLPAFERYARRSLAYGQLGVTSAGTVTDLLTRNNPGSRAGSAMGAAGAGLQIAGGGMEAYDLIAHYDKLTVSERWGKGLSAGGNITMGAIGATYATAGLLGPGATATIASYGFTPLASSMLSGSMVIIAPVAVAATVSTAYAEHSYAQSAIYEGLHQEAAQSAGKSGTTDQYVDIPGLPPLKNEYKSINKWIFLEKNDPKGMTDTDTGRKMDWDAVLQRNPKHFSKLVASSAAWNRGRAEDIRKNNFDGIFSRDAVASCALGQAEIGVISFFGGPDVNQELHDLRSEMMERVQRGAMGPNVIAEVSGDMGNGKRNYAERYDDYRRIIKPLEKDYADQVKEVTKLREATLAIRNPGNAYKHLEALGMKAYPDPTRITSKPQEMNELIELNSLLASNAYQSKEDKAQYEKDYPEQAAADKTRLAELEKKYPQFAADWRAAHNDPIRKQYAAASAQAQKADMERATEGTKLVAKKDVKGIQELLKISDEDWNSKKPLAQVVDEHWDKMGLSKKNDPNYQEAMKLAQKNDVKGLQAFLGADENQWKEMTKSLGERVQDMANKQDPSSLEAFVNANLSATSQARVVTTQYAAKISLTEEMKKVEPLLEKEQAVRNQLNTSMTALGDTYQKMAAQQAAKNDTEKAAATKAFDAAKEKFLKEFDELQTKMYADSKQDPKDIERWKTSARDDVIKALEKDRQAISEGKMPGNAAKAVQDHVKYHYDGPAEQYFRKNAAFLEKSGFGKRRDIGLVGMSASIEEYMAKKMEFAPQTMVKQAQTEKQEYAANLEMLNKQNEALGQAVSAVDESIKTINNGQGVGDMPILDQWKQPVRTKEGRPMTAADVIKNSELVIKNEEKTLEGLKTTAKETKDADLKAELDAKIAIKEMVIKRLQMQKAGMEQQNLIYKIRKAEEIKRDYRNMTGKLFAGAQEANNANGAPKLSDADQSEIKKLEKDATDKLATFQKLQKEIQAKQAKALELQKQGDKGAESLKTVKAELVKLQADVLKAEAAFMESHQKLAKTTYVASRINRTKDMDKALQDDYKALQDLIKIQQDPKKLNAKIEPIKKPLELTWAIADSADANKKLAQSPNDLKLKVEAYDAYGKYNTEWRKHMESQFAVLTANNDNVQAYNERIDRLLEKLGQQNRAGNLDKAEPSEDTKKAKAALEEFDKKHEGMFDKDGKPGPKAPAADAPMKDRLAYETARTERLVLKNKLNMAEYADLQRERGNLAIPYINEKAWEQVKGNANVSITMDTPLPAKAAELLSPLPQPDKKTDKGYEYTNAMIGQRWKQTADKVARLERLMNEGPPTLGLGETAKSKIHYEPPTKKEVAELTESSKALIKATNAFNEKPSVETQKAWMEATAKYTQVVNRITDARELRYTQATTKNEATKFIEELKQWNKELADIKGKDRAAVVKALTQKMKDKTAKMAADQEAGKDISELPLGLGWIDILKVHPEVASEYKKLLEAVDPVALAQATVASGDIPSLELRKAAADALTVQLRAAKGDKMALRQILAQIVDVADLVDISEAVNEVGMADEFEAMVVARMEETTKQEDKEKKEEKTSPAEELGAMKVKPAEPDKPGNVTYKDQDGQAVKVTRNDKGELIAKDDKGALLKAETLVTATVDDGKGGTTTQQFKVEQAGKMVQVPQTPNTGNTGKTGETTR